jgi:RNA polymerase sigma-70 factor (ECF subfamily)
MDAEFQRLPASSPTAATVPQADRAGARRRPQGPLRSQTIRGWQSRFADWSSAAISTTRASSSKDSSSRISAARFASPSVFATRPKPTKPQDAFVKVFGHIGSYREAWPFEVWFTRILINGCLDRRKARVRRDRWIVSGDDSVSASLSDRRSFAAAANAATPQADPEARLLARERRARMTAAVERLEGRQRTVFMLSHYGDCTPREVGAMIGLNESTVRVHLFRAARKLRALLGGQP